MAGKKRNMAQINGEIGVSILKKILPVEWVCREFSPDYGIDMAVEIFEKENTSYVTTGEHIYFQIKGTQNIEFGKHKVFERKNVEKAYTQGNLYEEIDVVKFDIETTLLATVEKMGSAVPVLLMVVDIEKEKVYFVCLNDYIEKVIIPEKEDYTAQDHIRIYIPVNNIIEKKEDVLAIRWYSKRAKLFSLFSKATYQNSELEYLDDSNLCEDIVHFAKIIRRLDAWSAAMYFYPLRVVLEELDYFLKYGITKTAEKRIREYEEKGTNIDEVCMETRHSCTEMSLRKCIQVSELRSLWNQICNCGFILEDLSKEWFLPTYMGCVTRE